jgi:multidrug resistance efflux pump
VSQLEVDQSRKKYDASVQRVASLSAKLDLVKGPSHEKKILALEHDLIAAKARLDRAQWRLNNCNLKAPVTGMILTKKAECGSLINPVVGGVSTSLCEMADLLDLEVDLEVDERDIAKVFVGQECTICVDAYPQRKYPGYVARMMPAGNRSKAILPIRVKVKIPAGEKQGTYLKPEMNALVSFFNNKSNAYELDKKDLETSEKKGKP